MKKAISILMTLVLMLGVLAGCGQSQAPGNTSSDAPAASSEAKPAEEKKAFDMKKEVEYVVSASPGGGSDIIARVIADIVQKNNLAPKPLMVVNKPGGACAVGYNYVGTKKGDPYTLLSLHSGNVIVSVVNGWDQDYEDLTDIIAIMAFDDLTLCVNADSPYKDMKSVIEAAKAAPDTLKFGSSQRGNSDQLGYELVRKYTGAKLNYVQYDSSGDVAGALLGGHVDIAILNPAECIGQVEAKKFIPIATFAEERIGGEFKDAPTFKEIGYPEIVLREYRGISGAKNMPAEAVAFYADMAKKITETTDWKEGYLAKNNLTPAFMGGDEAKEYAKKDTDASMALFKEVGYFDKK
ncbi:MAG: tripartite tricarboxylate transporter substrate binding protein [Clostridia bacterium]